MPGPHLSFEGLAADGLGAPDEEPEPDDPEEPEDPDDETGLGGEDAALGVSDFCAFL